MIIVKKVMLYYLLASIFLLTEVVYMGVKRRRRQGFALKWHKAFGKAQFSEFAE